jgi:hypothetical protein
MARVARFYGWPPAVLLDMSLGQLIRWDTLRDEIAAEEELTAMTIASAPYLPTKAKRGYVEGVRRRANPALPPAARDPARERRAKARLAMLLAGKVPDA